MAKRKKKASNVRARTASGPSPVMRREPPKENLAELLQIPITYQEISDYYSKLGEAKPHLLRVETYQRIQRITGRPLISYVTKTHNLNLNIPGTSGTPEIPAYIENSDLTGFGDLVQSVQSDAVDVIIESNGGSAEAAERIVRLLRQQFKAVRFIVPANAYSAATLMCFAGDEIFMDSIGTLDPIDPQINGVPARAILRGFETALQRLKTEGPHALTAYMPLISKYDLHILEICKSAEELSAELAKDFLSRYMLKCGKEDPRINNIVQFFSNYDDQKSHGRSIGRDRARELGLNVTNAESNKELGNLVRSIHNQYEIFFDKTTFFKLFESASGVSWGRQTQLRAVQVPAVSPPGTRP